MLHAQALGLVQLGFSWLKLLELTEQIGKTAFSSVLHTPTKAVHSLRKVHESENRQRLAV